MSSARSNSSDLQAIAVACNHCGAPLQLPLGTHYANCSYCGARLEVVREGGAACTKVLDEIDDRTKRIEAGVEELNHRERLEQLDREWMLSRNQYMIQGRGGSSLPTGAAIAASVFAAIFGIIWTGLAASMGAPVFFPLFGVIFVIVAIVGGISGANKASGYSRAESRYEQQRRSILADMDKRKSGKY
jgi:hypothetical protein